MFVSYVHIQYMICAKEFAQDFAQILISLWLFFKLMCIFCLSCGAQLVGITDGYLSLLKDNGDLREDLKLPEGDLGKEIESKFESGDEFLVCSFYILSNSHQFVYICLGEEALLIEFRSESSIVDIRLVLSGRSWVHTPCQNYRDYEIPACKNVLFDN